MASTPPETESKEPLAGVEYRVGSAVVTANSQEPTIIAHVTNDLGRMGAGFAGQLARRHPRVRSTFMRDPGSRLLGHVGFVRVAPGLEVANMTAQHGVRRRPGDPCALRYGPLRVCLDAVAARAKRMEARVVMPRIGAGLAGGDWEKIKPIIDASMKGIPCVVYELPS